MTFQLYLHINSGPSFYPYAGISNQSDRIVYISDDMIHIVRRDESGFREKDYLLTSRSFELDMDIIDEMIDNYPGEYTYSLVTRFGPYKHLTLTYYSMFCEQVKSYEIFEDYPAAAHQFVEYVYPVMQHVKEEVVTL